MGEVYIEKACIEVLKEKEEQGNKEANGEGLIWGEL
jgi:hypothetical protein